LTHELKESKIPSDSKEDKTKKKDETSKSRKILLWSFVALFIILFLVSNHIYIKKDVGPKDTDNHIIRAITYYNMLTGDRRGVKHPPQYPPGVYIISMPFFKAMGVSLESARISQSIFVIIFLLAMFGIGCELGGYWSGVVVMALSASSPHILRNSRLYYLDFPLAAICALSFYLLLKTDNYRNRKYSILFAIALSLAFLTKWGALFFLVLPIVWFLLPNLYKSKRSLTAGIYYLISLVIWIAGGILYYKNISPRHETGNWFMFYFLIIILPSIFLFFMMFRLEKKWKNEEGYRESKHYGMINFAVTSSIFLILSTPWYFYSAWTLKDRVLQEKYVFKNFPVSGSIQKVVMLFQTLFNFAPVLILIGLVFIFFYYRRQLYRRLLLPVNIILIFVLVINFIALLLFRHILPVIIFTAALGGFWVTHTGKIRPLIASVLILLSFLSIFAWTFIPGESKMYFPVRIFDRRHYPKWYVIPRVLCTETPDTNKYEMGGVIDFIFDNKAPVTGIITIDFMTPRHLEPEMLNLSAAKEGGFIGRIYGWSAHLDENGEVKFRRGVSPGSRLEDYGDILIFHEKSRSADPVVESVINLFNSPSYEVRVFDISRDYRVTFMKIFY